MNRLMILVFAAVILALASADEDVDITKRGVPCLCVSDGPRPRGNNLSGIMWMKTGGYGGNGCPKGWHFCGKSRGFFSDCCKR
uniref:Delta-actitoxin-Aeq2b 3 n=1 Tax=Actinia equina TaxID=6106 RepID=NA123_ACTEQ|nr:RecName: Full=Delta-actitoxin-Aeq2b 3; Short=Delta-AITX-Aeq2b 3; AltName: Full=Ae2-3; AltName: Full=Neurotoxin 2-3; Flags: Precursor [Actinia equina]ABW97360.1 putative neurotoxin 2-3 precursor [Actinia equina]